MATQTAANKPCIIQSIGWIEFASLSCSRFLCSLIMQRTLCAYPLVVWCMSCARHWLCKHSRSARSNNSSRRRLDVESHLLYLRTLMLAVSPPHLNMQFVCSKQRLRTALTHKPNSVWYTSIGNNLRYIIEPIESGQPVWLLVCFRAPCARNGRLSLSVCCCPW